ncbi:MAG: YceI family protein [Bacteroidota bacterium]
MKRSVFFSFFAVLGLFAMSFTTPTLETYTVDVESSKLTWVAKKVTGQHDGYVMLKGGSLEMTDGVLTGGSFEIDMKTITVTDLQAGRGKEKLEGHLHSPDFFNTAEFPTGKFTITQVFAVDTKGQYRVKGNLTVKGQTNDLKFNAMVSVDGSTITATAEDVVVDRTEYDVKYGSGSFFSNLGDKTIYDEFNIGITLVAGK